MTRRPVYPLSAIVGQEDLVEALLVCAVHPVVGGVLVRGERGTAKSTAVRALAPMLGGPLVDLPLGATLDRLVGSLDLRAALGGEHRVDTGLLGRADGGVLYVDEVNLLGDHLVDALLDAAAMGEVTIEREGVSVVQPARFLLVGTMNPEEGDLRPQLLDRFGLGVEIAGPRDAATRAAIVRRRMEFDSDPSAFAAEWSAEEDRLAQRIRDARDRVERVSISDRLLLRIANVCAQLDLDGIRGDLVTAQAARAIAALDGDDEVTDVHIDRAAHLALRHRLRRDPLAPPPDGTRDESIENALDDTPPEQEPHQESMSSQPPAASWNPDPDLAPSPVTRDPSPRKPQRPKAVPSRVPESALLLPRRRSNRAEYAPPGRSSGGNLAVVDARVATDDDPIAALPTLIASLRGDARLHTAITAGGRGALLTLIVDTSGSMAAQRRLARVKGAIEAAVRRAYARRDLVAVVAFSGEGGRTLVAPGDPLAFAAAAARDLPAGGRTPLAAGIEHAATLIENGKRDGRARLSILLTDGRAADPEGRARRALQRVVAASDRTVVVDLEDGGIRLGLAAELAAAAGADLSRLVTPERRSAA